MRRPCPDTFIRAAAPVAVPGRYSFKAKGGEAEILLYGDIGDGWFGGVTAKQFADDLKAAGSVDTINLRINSPGGDVFQGLTIYRLLVDHKAKIVVHIDGLAASIASVIAMAGEDIIIGEAAFLMIHNAWGVAIGGSADMRRTADLLDQTTASIRDVYVARTGNKADSVTAWMDAETWFTAAEAVDHGFATETAHNMRLAASIDPAKFRFAHAPAALMAAERAGAPHRKALGSKLADMRARLDRGRIAAA